MNIIKFFAARYFLMAYATVIVIMLFPLIFVLFANALAQISGCPDGMPYSNEVCTNGDIINGLSQAGWLLVFTLPVGLLLLGALLFINIVMFVLLKKRAAVAAFLFAKIRQRFTK